MKVLDYVLLVVYAVASIIAFVVFYKFRDKPIESKALSILMGIVALIIIVLTIMFDISDFKMIFS